MSIEHLTDIEVRTAQPRDKKYKMNDGGGLSLTVMPNGSKLWRFRYRVRSTGKPTELGLGSYPATGLKDARDRRDARRKELEAGVDPSKERKETKRAAKVTANNTFGATAREWLEMRRKKSKAHYCDLIQSQVERLLFPSLERRPIAEITTPELLEVLKKIPTACMQNQARGIAGQIFRFGAVQARCSGDPARAIVGALEMHEGRNFPTLDPKHLPKFLHDLDHYGENHCETSNRTRLRVNQAATQLLMLTALRSTELRLAQWSEIDLDNAIWEVPAERMKKPRNRKAGHGSHLVPLSRQAVAILRELRGIVNRIDRGSPYVFPSPQKKKQPFNKHVIGNLLDSLGYAGQHSPHGFRHLASTMLNNAHREDGSPRFHEDHIERQLSHIEGGTRGVYNKAQYLPQRTIIMQAWADMLDDERKRGGDGNVVPIKRKAA